MNNLKRVFSLALTGVMLSGMMVMGASAADFSDSEEIVNQDAVNGCVALSIINGRDDGTFDPDGLVTRAEMAKMIATAMNGGIAPEYGTKTTPSFTDIKGCWAEQYIEYCNNMKIIAGRGDGTFDPYGNVTGVEAAKMVLTALGYDAEAFRLVGADWDNNVNYEATWTCDPSLYDELGGVNMYNPITRDTAAQIIWNGVQNDTVTKTPDKTLSTGEVSFTYQSSNRTLFEVKYGGEEVTGTFKDNHMTNSSVKKGYITVGSVGILADLDISYIGEDVKVMYKDATGGTKGQLDSKDKIYGVFPTGKTSVVRTTVSDIKKVEKNGAEDTDKLKIDGTEYTVATPKAGTDTIIVKNYDTTGQATTAGDTGKDNAQAKFKALSNAKNGDAVKFILNEDGEVAFAYVVETKLGVVTAKTSEKVTIGTLGTIKIADNDVYEGIAKDDVVTYTKLYDQTTADAFVTVEKAEKVTGTVNGYKGTENIKVDGNTYKIFGEAYSAVTGLDNLTSVDGDVIGEDVELYLVNGYVAGVVQTSESATNYSVITAVKTGGSTDDVFTNMQVQVLDGEGVKSILTVSADSQDVANSDDVIDEDDYKVGDVVTYTIDKKGEAVLKMESQYTSPATKAYNKDTKTVGTDVTTNDTILFVETSNVEVDNLQNVAPSFKAYKIRSLASQDLTDAVVKSKDGKVLFVVADLAAKPTGATTDTVFGLVTGGGDTVKIDNVAYTTYSIYAGGDPITVNIKDGNTLNKGSIYGFVRTSDDIYANTDFEELSTTATANGTDASKTIGSETYKVLDVLVQEYNEADKILTYHTAKGTVQGDVYTQPTGTNTRALDDKAQIIYVNLDKDEAGDEIGVNKYDVTTGRSNALLVCDNETTPSILYIFVETSGAVDAFAKNS